MLTKLLYFCRECPQHSEQLFSPGLRATLLRSLSPGPPSGHCEDCRNHCLLGSLPVQLTGKDELLRPLSSWHMQRQTLIISSHVAMPTRFVKNVTTKQISGPFLAAVLTEQMKQTKEKVKNEITKVRKTGSLTFLQGEQEV